MKKVTQSFLFLLVLILVLNVTSSAWAWTYDRYWAANYADTYWNTPNSAYVYFYDDDCTNFTSQAIHRYGGKLPDDTDGSYVWYYFWNWYGPSWSQSWSVSYKQYNFLKYEPRGTLYNYASSLYIGDIIYYDWENDGRIDHSAIVVAKNSSNQPLVDAHSNNRYHAYWDLKAYGAPSSTRYYFMHVYGSGTN